MGPSLIELSAASLKNRLSYTASDHAVRTARALCPAQISRLGIRAPLQQQRVWSDSRVGTLPSFFRARRRLYRSCDGASVLVLKPRPLTRFRFRFQPLFVVKPILRLYSILVVPENLTSKVCS